MIERDQPSWKDLFDATLSLVALVGSLVGFLFSIHYALGANWGPASWWLILSVSLDLDARRLSAKARDE